MVTLSGVEGFLGIVGLWLAIGLVLSLAIGRSNKPTPKPKHKGD